MVHWISACQKNLSNYPWSLNSDVSSRLGASVVWRPYCNLPVTASWSTEYVPIFRITKGANSIVMRQKCSKGFLGIWVDYVYSTIFGSCPNLCRSRKKFIVTDWLTLTFTDQFTVIWNDLHFSIHVGTYDSIKSILLIWPTFGYPYDLLIRVMSLMNGRYCNLHKIANYKISVLFYGSWKLYKIIIKVWHLWF